MIFRHVRCRVHDAECIIVLRYVVLQSVCPALDKITTRTRTKRTERNVFLWAAVRDNRVGLCVCVLRMFVYVFVFTWRDRVNCVGMLSHRHSVLFMYGAACEMK